MQSTIPPSAVLSIETLRVRIIIGNSQFSWEMISAVISCEHHCYIKLFIADVFAKIPKIMTFLEYYYRVNLNVFM